LSRTITQLERRLGVALLERTSRKVTLTEAGSVLLAEGRAILAAVAAAERRTRQAATGQPPIVLGAKAGASSELLAKLLDAYAAQPGAVAVQVQLCESRPHLLLREGEVDVALLHEPYDPTEGFDTEVLQSENQVAILPATHPLAGRPQVRAADVSTLPDLPLARWLGPSGYTEGPGVEVTSLTQVYEMIALGRATAIVPESSKTDLRKDLTAVPVADSQAVNTVIAWPPNSRSRPLADLIRMATSL
jgi:DNA-binding transcriptional LysR family regulator